MNIVLDLQPETKQFLHVVRKAIPETRISNSTSHGRAANSVKGAMIDMITAMIGESANGKLFSGPKGFAPGEAQESVNNVLRGLLKVHASQNIYSKVITATCNDNIRANIKGGLSALAKFDLKKDAAAKDIIQAAEKAGLEVDRLAVFRAKNPEALSPEAQARINERIKNGDDHGHHR